MLNFAENSFNENLCIDQKIILAVLDVAISTAYL